MIKAVSVRCHSIRDDTTIGELIDETLEKLQKNGYNIIDVKLTSIGDCMDSNTTALILYEVKDND